MIREMKNLFAILASTVVACFLLGGCSEPLQSSQPKVPTAAEYRALLERRIRSSGGADIDVQKAVSEYKNSSDEKKKSLYQNAEKMR